MTDYVSAAQVDDFLAGIDAPEHGDLNIFGTDEDQYDLEAESGWIARRDISLDGAETETDDEDFFFDSEEDIFDDGAVLDLEPEDLDVEVVVPVCPNAPPRLTTAMKREVEAAAVAEAEAEAEAVCPSAPPRLTTAMKREVEAAAVAEAEAVASRKRSLLPFIARMHVLWAAVEADEKAAKETVSRTVRSARAHVARMKKARGKVSRCFF